jgi:hypothetical protein
MNSEWRCLISPLPGSHAYDVAVHNPVTKSAEDMDLTVFTDQRLHSSSTMFEVSLFFSVTDV